VAGSRESKAVRESATCGRPSCPRVSTTDCATCSVVNFQGLRSLCAKQLRGDSNDCNCELYGDRIAASISSAAYHNVSFLFLQRNRWRNLFSCCETRTTIANRNVSLARKAERLDRDAAGPRRVRVNEREKRLVSESCKTKAARGVQILYPLALSCRLIKR